MINFFLKKDVFIPFLDYGKTGGVCSFMTNLKKYLEKNDFKYSKKLRKSKAIFFPIAYDINKLKKFKSKKGKIIQRLDGIYYPQKHGDEYTELNRKIKEIYYNYVDFVIFQSKYSLQQCFELFGEKREEEYSIVINGVDTEIFFPNYNYEEKLREPIIFTTTGNFRNIDMVEPIVLSLDGLAQYNFQLNIVGPIKEEIKKNNLRTYIKYYGEVSLNKVSEILRETDIFIYSHLNPPCPNSVIEAIESGLPVVGFDSGAMKELLFFNKDLLAFVSDDIFQKFSYFKPELLREKIKLCIDKYSKYKKISMNNIGLYQMNKKVIEYINIFKQFI